MIQITSVRGIGGTPPVDIVVEGTHDGTCEKINVFVKQTNDPNVAPISAQAQLTPTGWTVTIRNSIGLTCGGEAYIVAVCSLDGRDDDPSFPRDVRTILALPCTEQCPSISNLSIGFDPNEACNAAGQRTITITGTILPAAGQTTALYDLYDPAFSTTMPIRSVPRPPLFNQPFSMTLPRLAGARHSFEIRPDPSLHPGCAVISRSIDLPSCTPACCPTVSIANVTPIGCAGDTSGRAATADFTASLDLGSCSQLPNPQNYSWRVTFPKQPNGTSGPAFVATSPGPNIRSRDILWRPDGSTLMQLPASLRLDKAGTYSISVNPTFPAGALDCAAAPGAIDNFIVRDCCPKLERIDATYIEACTWSFSAITTPELPIGATFSWDFGDGSMLVGTDVPGSSAQKVRHTFAPTTARTVRVIMRAPNCGEQALEIEIDGICSVGLEAPSTKGCAITPGENGRGSIKVAFDREIAAPGATDPNNYSVEVGNATQKPSSVAYDPIKNEAILQGLNIPQGERAKVTVSGISARNGGPIISDGKSNVTSCATKRQKKGRIDGGCAFLLILSAILLFLAAILFAVGICAAQSGVGVAVIILYIVAGVVLAISIGLLVLFIVLCVRGSDCDVLRWAMDVVEVMIWISLAIAFVSGLVGLGQQPKVPSGLACGFIAGIVGLATWGYWGTVHIILYNLGLSIGCLDWEKDFDEQPPDPELPDMDSLPTSSQSSPLRDASEAQRRDLGAATAESRPVAAAEQLAAAEPRAHSADPTLQRPPPRGIGDVISATTARIGIPGCKACAKRAEALNQAFPFR